MGSKDEKKTILDWLAEYWFLIFFLGGMAVTWGSFSTRISNDEARIITLESRIQQIDSALNDVKGGIIRIETSLEFIKERLKNETPQ